MLVNIQLQRHIEAALTFSCKDTLRQLFKGGSIEPMEVGYRCHSHSSVYLEWCQESVSVVPGQRLETEDMFCLLGKCR